MIKPYLVTYKFFYNEELRYHECFTELLEEGVEKHTVISGTSVDFKKLCALKENYNSILPLHAGILKNGESFLQFNDDLFSRITSKNCRPWKLSIDVIGTTLTIKELFRYDSEKVIQYLKERGITMCLTIK